MTKSQARKRVAHYAASAIALAMSENEDWLFTDSDGVTLDAEDIARMFMAAREFVNKHDRSEL